MGGCRIRNRIRTGDLDGGRQKGAGADADAGGPESEETGYGKKRVTPGSTAFVPAAAGLLMASVIVRDLTAAETGDRYE